MVLDVADAAHREAEAVSVRREVVEALAIVAAEAVVEVDHEDSLGLEASAEAVDEEAPHVAEVEEGTRWQDAHHERRFWAWNWRSSRSYGAYDHQTVDVLPQGFGDSFVFCGTIQKKASTSAWE